MSKELDDAYFRSTPCTHHEPLLSKLVGCVNLLEERIKGLLGATVSVGETETLPAGSEATVSTSKRGYDTVLDFGIPRGKDGSDATATDVRIKGISITEDGVADIPLAKYNTLGVCGIGTGLLLSSTGIASIRDPETSDVNERRRNQSITCYNLDYAVKAAMCDGKGAAWTAAEKTAAKKRIGITEGGSSGSRIWFSLQAPGHDMETDGYFGFKLAFLACSEELNPTDNVQAGDTILWNGYAYFVEDTDGNEALGATRLEFASHNA